MNTVSFKKSGAVLGLVLVALFSWGAAPPGQSHPGRRPVKAARTVFAPQPFMTGYQPSEAAANPADEIIWMVFDNEQPESVSDSPLPWQMSIFYESPGELSDRYARVVDDPTGRHNKVLQYWLRNAVIPAGYQSHTKGRIQSGFPAPFVDAVEMYARQRMYLHPDLGLLRNYPGDADPWWIGIILQELWSGAHWLGDLHSSRISLSLVPLDGTLRLYLRCHSADSDATYWSEVNMTYEVPVGQWITVETGYRMGDQETGRLVIVINNETTGEREVIFDVTNWTYDPEADSKGGPGPRSLTHWNPQKLYSSDNVLHYIRDHGGVAQVYWDDFAFGPAWPAAWP